MADESHDLHSLLSQAAFIYQNLTLPRAQRDEALVTILRAYWNNRTPEATILFRDVEVLKSLIHAYRHDWRRDEAVEVLVGVVAPVVRQIAWQVSCGNERRQFAEEAISLVIAPRERSVPRIWLYNPEQSLRAWLRTILGRLWIDQYRRAEPPHDPIPENVVDHRAPPNPSPLAWEEQVRPAVEHLRPDHRVEVLIATGLWSIVPEETQQHYLNARNGMAEVSPLPCHFPDTLRDGVTSPADWMGRLAEAFGCSLNALRVQCYRFREQLRKQGEFEEC
jgi:hypothetical protein